MIIMEDGTEITMNEAAELAYAALKESKFDVVCSNPPYQEAKSTKNIDIWQNFLFTASLISRKSIMIHPARWVNPKMRMQNVHDQIIASNLKHFIIFSTPVFPNIEVNGGISITILVDKWDDSITYGIDGSGFIYDYDPTLKFFYSEVEKKLYEAVKDDLSNGTIDSYRIKTLGGISTVFYGIDKYDFHKTLSLSDAGMKEPIRVWANMGFGSGSKHDWYYIERDKLQITQKEAQELDRNKLMLDKTGHAFEGGGNIIHNHPRILGPNELSFGTQFYLILQNNSTDDLRLLASLMNTKFARALMYITQKDHYVRGLDNIPDFYLLKKKLVADGEQFFTDKWFYEYYNLSEEVVNHIESKIRQKPQLEFIKSNVNQEPEIATVELSRR